MNQSFFWWVVSIVAIHCYPLSTILINHHWGGNGEELPGHEFSTRLPWKKPWSYSALHLPGTCQSMFRIWGVFQKFPWEKSGPCYHTVSLDETTETQEFFWEKPCPSANTIDEQFNKRMGLHHGELRLSKRISPEASARSEDGSERQRASLP